MYLLRIFQVYSEELNKMPSEALTYFTSALSNCEQIVLSL